MLQLSDGKQNWTGYFFNDQYDRDGQSDVPCVIHFLWSLAAVRMEQPKPQLPGDEFEQGFNRLD